MWETELEMKESIKHYGNRNKNRATFCIEQRQYCKEINRKWLQFFLVLVMDFPRFVLYSRMGTNQCEYTESEHYFE